MLNCKTKKKPDLWNITTVPVRILQSYFYSKVEVNFSVNKGLCANKIGLKNSMTYSHLAVLV